MGLEGQRADRKATKLVNVPLFQLQNGRAKVPDFVQLSSGCRESYVPTSEPNQARPDERSYRCYNSVAFPGVAGGRIAGAGDNCRLLVSDAL